MKQPMMHVTDKDGKDWGLKKVVSIRWSTGKYANGNIVHSMVDFMENGTDETLFSNRGDGVFIDIHGYLLGKLIWETPVCEQESTKESNDD